MYVQCRTLGKIDYVFVLVYCVLREERNLDVAAVAEGGECAVRIGPTEGLLKIVERFLAVLAANLLERHDVRVQPLGDRSLYESVSKAPMDTSSSVSSSNRLSSLRYSLLKRARNTS